MKSKFTVLTILLACSIGPGFTSDVSEVNATAMTQHAMAAYQRNDFESAIKYLTARAKMAPDDPNVYYYLGNCYMHTKQPEQAAHMYSACIRMSPTSQAGQYSLTALESISALPKAAPPETTVPDPAVASAVKDSLLTDRALDKAYNDALTKIRSHRQTLKITVDHIWEDLSEEMQQMSPKTTPNYAAELEKLQRDAENKVQDAHLKQLRYENRLIAPDKIDVRAVPELPQEKTDDTKTALGSLMEYFKPDKEYDPFAPEVTPEMTAKFMTLRDVYGELATYEPSTRKLAKQSFFQLKSGIETKQDSLDQQIYQLKANLIRDITNIKASYGSVPTYSVQPNSFLTSAKIPRSKSNNMTPAELEVQNATERAKKRIQELKDSYQRDVDALIAGAKDKVGGVVAQSGQMNSQLKKSSGTIQIVPMGTDAYTRNYVNFGDRTGRTTRPQLLPVASPVPLRAGEAQKLPRVKATSSAKPTGQ